VTAKQTIKARCRDCSGRECEFEECVLKGLAKAKVSKKAILAYCRWCLNGHPFTVCSSPDCAIYQYRKEQEEARRNPGLAKKQGYRGGFSTVPEKRYPDTPPAPEGA
jgi:hypothetical protein